MKYYKDKKIKQSAVDMIMCIIETYSQKDRESWTKKDKDDIVYDLLDAIDNTIRASGEN